MQLSEKEENGYSEVILTCLKNMSNLYTAYVTLKDSYFIKISNIFSVFQ